MTLAFALAALTALALAASAGAEVVYNNIEPRTLVENPVSLGYQATGTSEFGSQVVLAGEARKEPEVEVLMSVWSCQTGGGATCVTTPGATFSAPITLKVYEVTYENKPGALIESVSGTFNLEYRPSTDPSCPDGTAFKDANGHCDHGKPEAIKFKLAKTLPRKVIVSVAYNTQTWGYAPTGVEGPMNSLNVGLEGPALIGQNPTEVLSGVYWGTKTYSDHTGVFHYTQEPTEWSVGESQIAMKISASSETGKSATGNGASGTSATGNTNSGSLALKRKMSISFPKATGSVSGSNAAVLVRCNGSIAERCVGTLTLKVSGKAHKVVYTVSKGKQATITVPLGSSQSLAGVTSLTARAVARTEQPSGRPFRTSRKLRLG